MSELENVEVIAKTEEDRRDIINKIIACGVNSLSESYGENDKELMRRFISQHFEDIIPCWGMLTEKVQFSIFKLHIDSFKAFMLSTDDRKSDDHGSF